MLLYILQVCNKTVNITICALLFSGVTPEESDRSLKTVQPLKDVLFTFPLDQLIYFRIRHQVLLGESDKFFLQNPLLAKIHLQIHHCGLHILMS